MKFLIWALAIGIVVMQFMDYWTTLKVLERGGVELNPVMAKLMKMFGRQIGLLIGKLYAAVFVLLGAYLGWFESTIGFTALVLLFGLYAVVVNNNLTQYRGE